MDIEKKKRQELLQWYRDLEFQISQKEDIISPDNVKKQAVEYLNLDGFYPGYFEAKKKILFLGRESRDVDGCNRMDTDIEFLKNTNINGFGYIYWQRIFYIVYGILHEGRIPYMEIPSANEIKDFCVRENRFPFAFINLSKYSNDDNSNWQADSYLINRFLKDAEFEKRNFIREQISILEPDVIISCNLWEIKGIDHDKINLVFPKEDFGDRNEALSTNGVSDVYQFNLNGKSITFIDLYHISASRVGNLRGHRLSQTYYYDPVMKALFQSE